MKSKLNVALFIISVIGFLLLSISFILMPLNKESLEPNIFAGILFWCSLLIGIVSQVWLSIRIKNNNRNGNRRGIGLIKFFQNPYAKISDIMFVVSVIGLLTTIAVTNGSDFSCYVFLAMTVFFFAMHCVFNGKNYYYTSNNSALDNKMSEKKQKES